jgi:hypothetical protein
MDRKKKSRTPAFQIGKKMEEYSLTKNSAKNHITADKRELRIIALGFVSGDMASAAIGKM